MGMGRDWQRLTSNLSRRVKWLFFYPELSFHVNSEKLGQSLVMGHDLGFLGLEQSK